MFQKKGAKEYKDCTGIIEIVSIDNMILRLKRKIY